MTPAPAPGVPRRGDLQLFFNAAGRLNRGGYVAATAACIVLGRLPAIFAEGFWRALAAALCWPVAVVAAATLGCKRLHDLGLSGWWVAFPLALLWVCAAHPPSESAVGSAMAGVIAVALALLAGWPGEPHYNRFGPPPG